MIDLGEDIVLVHASQFARSAIRIANETQSVYATTRLRDHDYSLDCDSRYDRGIVSFQALHFARSDILFFHGSGTKRE
jgi:hypothetical protein